MVGCKIGDVFGGDGDVDQCYNFCANSMSTALSVVTWVVDGAVGNWDSIVDFFG